VKADRDAVPEAVAVLDALREKIEAQPENVKRFRR